MKNYYHLHIDLTSGKHQYTDCSALFSEWLGGTGAATRLFVDYCKTLPLDPFAPEAPVIFAIGPMNIYFPVITKTVALFHSPLTGDLGESHAGGRLSLAMHESQNHVITLVGKVAEWSYLVIENQEIRIVKAKSLQGFSATATERILRNKEVGVGKRSIMRIGPAGERLSPMACVSVDASRHFGRMGLGAVLGSKKIKAIVVSGNQTVALPETQGYKKTFHDLHKTITQSTAMQKYHNLGTAMNILPLHHSNALPTRNFSQGYFEGASLISGEAFARHDLSQQISCAGCPIGCIHLATQREAFDPSENMVKSFKTAYDFELIFALGSNLSLSSRSDILRLIQETERQAWDAISIGGTLAWAVEAFQKAYIGKEETLGEVLRFGDAALFLRMMKHIAQASNAFYADLEKGSVYCAEKYGGSELTVAFGKNEAPGYLTGMYAFLGFATGVRHSHLDSAGYDLDLRHPAQDSSPDQLHALYEEALWRMILNSLVACLFSRKVYMPEQILQCLKLLGYDPELDIAQLRLLSRRIHGLKYRCKMLLGFQWDSLKLPDKLASRLTFSGKLDAEGFLQELQKYRTWIQSDMELVKE